MGGLGLRIVARVVGVSCWVSLFFVGGFGFGCAVADGRWFCGVADTDVRVGAGLLLFAWWWVWAGLRWARSVTFCGF